MSDKNLLPNTSPELTELNKEPWVTLDDGKHLSEWTHEDEVVYNQKNRQTEKYIFFRKTMDFLKDNRIEGDYYEFGCHRCRTFRMALSEARKHCQDLMQFYAFDSFEGLPEPTSDTSVEIWTKGALSTSEEAFRAHVVEHGIYLENYHTIKGFYSDSLTNDLQNKFLSKNRKASLINIDCDLYESAVPVFEFIEPLLQEGTIIYLDDQFAGYKGNPMKGVSKAFLEWQEKTKWRVVQHLQIGWWGRSYIVYSSEEEISKIL